MKSIFNKKIDFFMIISGYPAIGKSSLAKLSVLRVIDLESSDFIIDNNRIPDWYVIYCKIAERLSNQGYTVFVSCHSQVRSYFREHNINYCVIAPTIEFKDNWIKKIENRYNEDPTPKNRRALEYATKYYEDDIKKLFEDESQIIGIDEEDYKLEDLIEAAKEHYEK